MRVVCAYNPCYNTKQNSSTSYQQQRRYWINSHQDLSCPCLKFRDYLVSQLREWRANGDKLIICMDANESVYTKSMGKLLTYTDWLSMSEIMGVFTQLQLQATYFHGSKPIDAIWATPDIHVTDACVMTCIYSVSNHRLFVVDFSLRSFNGNILQKVIRPSACRLNTCLSYVLEKYNSTLEKLFQSHRILEKMEKIANNSVSSDKEIYRSINQIGKEISHYMRAAEKCCWKIKSRLIPFLPEVVTWIQWQMDYASPPPPPPHQGRKKEEHR